MSEFSQLVAIILAGGLGTRLRRIISDKPKVMAEINEKPFLCYLLDQLAEIGIERVVISTGHLAYVIEKAIGFSYKGLQVDYSKEETPLGTAGALKFAVRAVDTSQCIVFNGDSYTEFDQYSLLMSHIQCNSNITLVVKSVDKIARFGSIQIKESCI